MGNRIYLVLANPGNSELVSVILKALNQYQQGAGDLHVVIYMLATI